MTIRFAVPIIELYIFRVHILKIACIGDAEQGLVSQMLMVPCLVALFGVQVPACCSECRRPEVPALGKGDEIDTQAISAHEC